jgi:hypothetical protein
MAGCQLKPDPADSPRQERLRGYTSMIHNHREPYSALRYIARRVWRRLLLALYANRITVAVAIVILIALGLFSLRGRPARRGGRRRRYAHHGKRAAARAAW